MAGHKAVLTRRAVVWLCEYKHTQFERGPKVVYIVCGCGGSARAYRHEDSPPHKTWILPLMLLSQIHTCSRNQDDHRESNGEILGHTASIHKFEVREFWLAMRLDMFDDDKLWLRAVPRRSLP
jgi:hypothetical protein